MQQWFSNYAQELGWLAATSAGMLLVAIILLPLVIGTIPADYFVAQDENRSTLENCRPTWNKLLWLIRNTVGSILLLLGVLMLVLPGQGLLTILAGLVIVTFPGKRRLELRLLRQSAIRRTVCRIRHGLGKEPLQFPDEEISARC